MATKKAAKKAAKKAVKKTAKSVQRTKMSDAESEKFLIRHLKERELNGAAATAYIRRHAATRLAALDRYNKKNAA